MNLTALLHERAAQDPNRPALVETRRGKDYTVTYGMLASRVAGGAEQLRSLGLAPGATLWLMQPVSIRLYEVMLAAFHAGLRVMLADPKSGADFLRHVCETARPDAYCGPLVAHLLRWKTPAMRAIPRPVLTSGWLPGMARWNPTAAGSSACDGGKTAPQPGQVAAELHHRGDANEIVLEDRSGFVRAVRPQPDRSENGPCLAGPPANEKARDGSAPLDVPDDEPALITFTSGSTGMPKGAVRTHGLLMAQFRALEHPLELHDGGVDLVTLPVFVLANLAAGLTSVLADTDLSRPGHPRVAAVAAQCRRLGVTRSTASPAFFEGLMAAGCNLPGFRKIFTGGGPVFPDFVRRMTELLPAAEIHAVYGSTEAEPIAHAASGEADGRSGVTAAGGGLAAGRPTAGTEVRIIRQSWGQALGPLEEAEFDAMTLPPLEAGEIVVAGPQVLPGYLNGVGDEETKIPVGGRIFHRTGDAGWRDPEGCLWLLGRCAEVLPPPHDEPHAVAGIPRDAHRYPLAVECALRERFATVRTAALDWHGKRLLAVGVKADDPTFSAIRHAAAEWQMDEVVAVPSIPLDHRHQAKVNYPALRALLQNSALDLKRTGMSSKLDSR